MIQLDTTSPQPAPQLTGLIKSLASRVGDSVKQLYKQVAPWEDPEPAEIPSQEGKSGEELVRYTWAQSNPSVRFKQLPVELRVLLVFSTMVSDMSLKQALTMKQKVADDLGKRWADFSYQKTMAGARTVERWANIGQTAALAFQFVLPYGVPYLRTIQDKCGEWRPHDIGWDRLQGWIDSAARNIPMITGKHEQDIRSSIKSVGPGISQYTREQGGIAQTEAQGRSQFGQFWTQKQERDNQTAAGFKQEVNQIQQEAYRAAQEQIEKLSRLNEKTASA
ncbi:MAG: hypothetical protein AB7F31_00970 [Parachlamydiales bacterium]